MTPDKPLTEEQQQGLDWLVEYIFFPMVLEQEKTNQ